MNEGIELSYQVPLRKLAGGHSKAAIPCTQSFCRKEKRNSSPNNYHITKTKSRKHKYETEKAKINTFSSILPLLVYPSGRIGRCSYKVPDVGGPPRVVRLGGDFAVAFGHYTDYCSL